MEFVTELVLVVVVGKFGGNGGRVSGFGEELMGLMSAEG